MIVLLFCAVFFFFNDTATTEIYTLSLHDALPISCWQAGSCGGHGRSGHRLLAGDRKSTRLNSSHLVISYAVFCLKKKNKDCTTRSRRKHSSTSTVTTAATCAR